MDKEKISDVLLALTRDDKNRSETARLREIIEEVENALHAGVNRAAILKALHGQGFTMTSKSFESALYRIRKKREKPVKKFSLRNGQYDVTASNLAPTPSSRSPEIIQNDLTTQLDEKQKRELQANRYIKPANTNPLLNRKKEP